jgi:hypothetical protein
MRTTLVIDDHVMRELKDKAHRTGQPLKRVVNDALRVGLEQLQRPSQMKPCRVKTYSMGYPPRVNLDKAMEIASALEEEEIARKLRLRK